MQDVSQTGDDLIFATGHLTYISGINLAEGKVPDYQLMILISKLKMLHSGFAACSGRSSSEKTSWD